MSTVVKHKGSDLVRVNYPAETILRHSADAQRVATMVAGVSTNIPDAALRAAYMQLLRADELVYRIAIELGIEQPDRYVAERFAWILARRFPEITLQEIGLACELYVIGTLDGEMDKIAGRDGSKHFGKCSTIFLIRLVQAYTNYRNLNIKTQEKMLAALPAAPLTEEESWERSRPIIKELVGMLLNALQGGANVFDFPWQFAALYLPLGGSVVFPVDASIVPQFTLLIQEHCNALNRQHILRYRKPYEVTESELVNYKRAIAVCEKMKAFLSEGKSLDEIANQLVRLKRTNPNESSKSI